MTNDLRRPGPDPVVPVVITGALHSGKTTLAGRLVDHLRSNGYRVAGILSAGSWQNGLRNRFHVTDLSSGLSELLAERSDKPAGSGMAFRFHEKGIDAGRAALRTEVCRNAQVVVVDEIGKLELDGKGWAPCLQPLLLLKGIVHVWVVREQLLPAVCTHWDIEPGIIVDCEDPDAIDILTHEIERLLSG